MSLECLIREAFQGLAGEVRPRADAWARLEARVRAHHRRRVGLTSVLAVAVAVAAALAIPRESPRILVPAPPREAGWRTYRDAQLGWSMLYPPGWHAQSFDERRRVWLRGALVSNIDHVFDHPAIKDGWTSAWDMRGLPSSLVAVEFRLMVRGGPGRRSVPPDTPFPLSLDQAGSHGGGPEGAAEYGAPPSLDLPVTVRGNAYFVTVWIGPGASEKDKEIARRVVESISFEADGGSPSP
ncbi:MAG: hypothetical protein HY775_03535 [Acidobacteria bacterium]|nr:hypothetical protein [Acidobacteriota bacterium]